MFKDKQNREFEGIIVLPTMVKLKKIGVDLNDDLPKLMESLMGDGEQLCGALYTIHEKSILEHNLSPDDFGNLLDGDVLPLAVDSLQDAIINFSRPAIREPLRKVFQKSQELEAILGERMNQAADQITDEMILSTLSNTAGASLESSESTSAKTENSDQSRSENSILQPEQNDVTSGTDSAN